MCSGLLSSSPISHVVPLVSISTFSAPSSAQNGLSLLGDSAHRLHRLGRFIRLVSIPPRVRHTPRRSAFSLQSRLKIKEVLRQAPGSSSFSHERASHAVLR